MYIVRWLIGHPILAAWVLAIIAILLNFGGNDKTDHSGIADSSDKQKKVMTTGSTTKNNIPEDSLVSMQSKNLELENATDTSTTASLGVDAAALDQLTLQENNQSSSVTEKAIPVSESETKAVSDLGQASSEEMLIMAREAYWNNGLDEAADIYLQLIKLEPKVVEHQGELGNVYWRQGYPKKAAELYAEIAIPMIEKGSSEKVANMIGFIGLFYPDRAAEINKRLQATSSNSQ